MDTTQIYLHASLELKEKALAKRSRSEAGLDGIVHQTSSWPSCKPSNNAE